MDENLRYRCETCCMVLYEAEKFHHLDRYPHHTVLPLAENFVEEGKINA